MNEKEKLSEIKARYDVLDHVEQAIKIPPKPKNGLVLIVGSSGSGKSTILRSWMEKDLDPPKFDNSKSVIENFSSISRGEELLLSFGLRSIPTWFRPFKTLSNGEQHRAECALSIDRGDFFIDEFTSVVDRNTAIALSCSVRKFYKDGLLVIVSCHRDIIDWLQPDIIYDTDKCDFIERGCLRRPKIVIDILPSSFEDWVYFKKHHYLNSDVSKACHFYKAMIGDSMVAFYAVMHFTSRDIPSYWRGSRLVVLPEFQGLGIGTAFSDAIAEEYVLMGKRFYAKTAHKALGEYRNNSPNWRGTSKNMKKRNDYLRTNADGKISEKRLKQKSLKNRLRDSDRVCYSHEYIGVKK